MNPSHLNPFCYQTIFIRCHPDLPLFPSPPMRCCLHLCHLLTPHSGPLSAHKLRIPAASSVGIGQNMLPGTAQSCIFRSVPPPRKLPPRFCSCLCQRPCCHFCHLWTGRLQPHCKLVCSRARLPLCTGIGHKLRPKGLPGDAIPTCVQGDSGFCGQGVVLPGRPVSYRVVARTRAEQNLNPEPLCNKGRDTGAEAFERVVHDGLIQTQTRVADIKVNDVNRWILTCRNARRLAPQSCVYLTQRDLSMASCKKQLVHGTNNDLL